MYAAMINKRTSAVENVERHLKEKTMSNVMKRTATLSNSQVVVISYDKLELQHHPTSKSQHQKSPLPMPT